jgi:hypothetical protein
MKGPITGIGDGMLEASKRSPLASDGEVDA